MRINSVNSVNPNQQRNQNFGMAFKKSGSVTETLLDIFTKEACYVQCLTECLRNVRTNQAGNHFVDLIMDGYGDKKIVIQAQTKSTPKKVLAVLKQDDEAYKDLSQIEAIQQMLKDADSGADDIKGFMAEMKEIEDA